MDWLEYVKGELINKGWSAPKVRANEAFIAAAISIADYDQSAAADYQAAKQERERLKGLVKVIEKYETEEARDRARLAILFDKMRGSLISKDDAAYITWLGAILAGYFTKDALEALEESEA